MNVTAILCIFLLFSLAPEKQENNVPNIVTRTSRIARMVSLSFNGELV